jgi:hypothetical protein
MRSRRLMRQPIESDTDSGISIHSIPSGLRSTKSCGQSGNLKVNVKPQRGEAIEDNLTKACRPTLKLARKSRHLSLTKTRCQNSKNHGAALAMLHAHSTSRGAVSPQGKQSQPYAACRRAAHIARKKSRTTPDVFSLS